MPGLRQRTEQFVRTRPALARLLRRALGPTVRRMRARSAAAVLQAGTAGGVHFGWRARLRNALLRLQARLGWRVTPDDVRWCYRELLGREPESEAAVAAHLHFRDLQALMAHMTLTPEYLARIGQGHRATALRGKLAPISADDFRRSIDIHLRRQPAGPELQSYVEVHFKRLLHTLNTMQALLPRGARVLDYSAAGFFTHAVRQLVGDVQQSSVQGVNFELDDYVARYGEDCYDLVVNTEVLEHLGFDPAHMVLAINRMLKTGGGLFLTTPNAVSMANCLKILDGNAPALWNPFRPGKPYYERHNREWAPQEVARLLQEHGFEVERLYTEDFYASTQRLLDGNADRIRWLRAHASHDHFGDTVCVVARKRHSVQDVVRSEWLYA